MAVIYSYFSLRRKSLGSISSIEEIKEKENIQDARHISNCSGYSLHHFVKIPFEVVLRITKTVNLNRKGILMFSFSSCGEFFIIIPYLNVDIPFII